MSQRTFRLLAPAVLAILLLLVGALVLPSTAAGSASEEELRLRRDEIRLMERQVRALEEIADELEKLRRSR